MEHLDCYLVAMNSATPTLEDLRPELVEQVRRLPAEQLLALRNYLVDLEIKRLVADIDDAFDKADVAGQLSPAAIESSIRAFREMKPYR